MRFLPFHEAITARTILIYSLGLCVGVVFVLYILFQARFLIAGPQIVLYPGPQNPQKERVVLLEGTAENIVRITLNGRQIYTDTTGYFKEELVLENGYTIATLEAEDRYGRVQTLSRAFVYDNAQEEEILGN